MVFGVFQTLEEKNFSKIKCTPCLLAPFHNKTSPKRTRSHTHTGTRNGQSVPGVLFTERYFFLTTDEQLEKALRRGMPSPILNVVEHFSGNRISSVWPWSRRYWIVGHLSSYLLWWVKRGSSGNVWGRLGICRKVFAAKIDCFEDTSAKTLYCCFRLTTLFAFYMTKWLFSKITCELFF